MNALLSNLQTDTPNIPLPTLQSLLSHHLSSSPLTLIQLTATAISSPFFNLRTTSSEPLEFAKVQAFETALRHAVHLTQQIPLKNEKGKGKHVNLSRWTTDVVEGIQGGHPILRLAACGGILLGVDDLKRHDHSGLNGDVEKMILVEFERKQVESEAVVAFAEVLDSMAMDAEWETEFRQDQDLVSPQSPRTPISNDTVLQAFILGSHFFTLIDPQRLVALPLYTIASLLTRILESSFEEPPTHTTSSSRSKTRIDDVPSLAKFTSLIFRVLLESTRSRTYERSLNTVLETFGALLDLSRKVERAYSNGQPASQIPKQFLFTTLIISRSVLSSLVYLPQYRTTTTVTPSSLGLIILQTLTHLSFVIAQFGGVTKGFEELQRVFYLAVDFIHSSNRLQDQDRVNQDESVETYVRQLSQLLQSQMSEPVATPSFRAKLSFALLAIEQLVPLLTHRSIIDHVWVICLPYLTDLSDSNREIYESTLSVILSILVHDSQTRHSSSGVLPDSNNKEKEEEVLWTRFIQRLVVFYSDCLIKDPTLTITQLGKAYSSLVQCASGLPTTDHFVPADANSNDLQDYCVRSLMDNIDALSSTSSILKSELALPSSDTITQPLSTEKRLHRLHSMLASILPFLSLEMFQQSLDCLQRVFVGQFSEEEEVRKMKRELAETLLEVLVSEDMMIDWKLKELGVKWWYENLETIRGSVGETIIQARL